MELQRIAADFAPAAAVAFSMCGPGSHQPLAPHTASNTRMTARRRLVTAAGTPPPRRRQSLIEFSEVTKKAGKFGEKTISISKEELARLRAIVRGLSVAEARDLLRAFSTYFALVNLAEQLQRGRMRCGRRICRLRRWNGRTPTRTVRSSCGWCSPDWRA